MKAKVLSVQSGEGGILSVRKATGQHNADPVPTVGSCLAIRTDEVPMTVRQPILGQPACTANKPRKPDPSRSGLFAGDNLLPMQRMYSRWNNMKIRCLDPEWPGYKNYGGRGITICDRWLESFFNFYDDMGLPPKGLTLERVNNDGPYSPENCVWASSKAQIANRRRYKWRDDRVAVAPTRGRLGSVEIDGRTMTVNAALKKFGVITPAALHFRLQKGWPISMAILLPPAKYSKPNTKAVHP